VDVGITSTTVKVDITGPHANYFAGVVGQPTWDVSVTATALAGVPKKFSGVAPFILSQDLFDPKTGLPYKPYTSSNPYTKTQGSGSDAPLDYNNMAWTNLGTGNVSSKDIKDALLGNAPINADLAINDYVGQHNNGVQNDLFDTNSPQQPSINTTLHDTTVAVPIVGPPTAGHTTCNDGTHTVGCFQGWALFHVDSASKNAPAGSETAVAVLKSAVAAANNAFESVQKAVKQASDVAEANFNAVSAQAVNAAKTATAKAKR